VPESAFRVFQLPGRDTKIKKRTADGVNAELIENTECAPEIRLSHGEPVAVAGQLLTNVLDGVRIPVESQNISPALQKRFGVATAAACGIYDERPWLWFE
jgi:hypothetical protein